MELKLANGVKVGVADELGNKVLRFNVPVKLVDLTPEEASKIGISLNRSKRLTALPALSGLMESGFLNQPKSLPEIRGELAKLSLMVKTSSLTMALTSLARKGIIGRNGKPGNYAYHKK